ncbi:hypothetical protein OGAPHI_003539 [Ogataea philodendri]|uniref:Uncharacterized protein n=1 Tax=Ogataea philodendri TaxID=1378263 RepID=A0A9P8P738_9ASCO|nr:uncharacterized protein OGAPHI_003539 [Ogataea philodendri]KAH3666542.1 hypothetical protein OGAPHI_003539 [Ogataea philodendri]
MNSLIGIRSSSQARSNRSRSRSLLGSGHSSISTSRSGSRSRSNSNRGSSFNVRGSVDNYSFTGLNAPEKNMAFDDPKERNLEKELERTFWRKFRENVVDNDDTWIKLFLILSCLSAIITLAIECAICGLFMDRFKLLATGTNDYNPILAVYGYYRSFLKQKRYAMGAYLALYIYAELYLVIMTLIVLYTRNVYHLMSSVLFLAAMAIYSGIQYNEITTTITSFNTYNQLFTSTTDAFQSGVEQATRKIKGLSIAVIVIASLACLVQSAIGYKLKDKFQQFTGEAVGNNRKMIYANTVFNLHRDALLLALFFAPGYFLQSVIIAPNKSDAEFGLTIAALVLSFLVVFGADFCTSREKKLPSTFFSACCTIGLGFIVFKIVRVYLRYPSNGQDLPGRKSVVAFGVITAVLLLCLMILLLQVIRNFELGLYSIYAGNYNWLVKAREKYQEELDQKVKLEVSKDAADNAVPSHKIQHEGQQNGDSPIKVLPDREELDF